MVNRTSFRVSSYASPSGRECMHTHVRTGICILTSRTKLYEPGLKVKGEECRVNISPNTQLGYIYNTCTYHQD